MNTEEKKKFLDLVSSGHDTSTASHELGIEIPDNPEFQQEIKEAYSLAAGRLRARLMQAALLSSDVKSLTDLLNRLEVLAGASNQITGVARIIIAGRCSHCGHTTGAENIGKQEFERRVATVLEKKKALVEQPIEENNHG